MKKAKPYTQSAWDKIGNEQEYNSILINIIVHCNNIVKQQLVTFCNETNTSEKNMKTFLVRKTNIRKMSIDRDTRVHAIQNNTKTHSHNSSWDGPTHSSLETQTIKYQM